MKTFGTLLLIVGAIVLASCAPAPTPEPTPLPTPTPLELFEVIVGQVSSASFTASRTEYEPHCAKIAVSEVAYDVEATTSLVSPFTGTIVYSINEPTYDYEITELYAFQDGSWVLKDTKVDNSFRYDNSLLGFGYCTMLKP